MQISDMCCSSCLTTKKETKSFPKKLFLLTSDPHVKVSCGTSGCCSVSSSVNEHVVLHAAHYPCFPPPADVGADSVSSTLSFLSSCKSPAGQDDFDVFAQTRTGALPETHKT